MRSRRRARALIEEVDALGGAAGAIERGFFQEAIARSAYEMQKAQESGELVVVGRQPVHRRLTATRHRNPGLLGARGRAARRLAETRRGGNRTRSRSARTLCAAAAGTTPLMPPIVDAVRARATLGEISDTLRDVWGVYRPGVGRAPGCAGGEDAGTGGQAAMRRCGLIRLEDPLKNRLSFAADFVYPSERPCRPTSTGAPKGTTSRSSRR